MARARFSVVGGKPSSIAAPSRTVRSSGVVTSARMTRESAFRSITMPVSGGASPTSVAKRVKSCPCSLASRPKSRAFASSSRALERSERAAEKTARRVTVIVYGGNASSYLLAPADDERVGDLGQAPDVDRDATRIHVELRRSAAVQVERVDKAVTAVGLRGGEQPAERTRLQEPLTRDEEHEPPRPVDPRRRSPRYLWLQAVRAPTDDEARPALHELAHSLKPVDR